jgi:hypothetical protein
VHNRLSVSKNGAGIRSNEEEAPESPSLHGTQLQVVSLAVFGTPVQVHSLQIASILCLCSIWNAGSDQYGPAHIMDRESHLCSLGKTVAAILILMLWAPTLLAQSSPPADELATVTPSESLPPLGSLFLSSPITAGAEPAFTAAAEPASFIRASSDPNIAGGVQTKRIAGFIPNFQAVSAGVVLPPLSFKQELLLARQNSFDYSSFVFVGVQSSIEQATNAVPEFHSGKAAFARYYWYTFADQAAENFITGDIFPALTHEEPRYYTLYHGSFLHRAVYAFSRLWITRNDAGNETFNISEIVGAGVATGVSGLYYPRQARVSVGENFTKLAAQLLNDGIGNGFEEFWPDINRKFLHEH